MSYQALYRQYRPLTFEDVCGQDAIVTTLKNQIRQKRIGHAYLFCGTRGTGKTSVAKIFARAVNCMEAEAHGGSPCNACDTCRAILSGNSMNVFEIDAASNNGVDNIRDIREQVEYPPTEGRYKVYIIDEVHMLSTGAFNALLKTLEEPPAYVIFILATTDPQKLPQTILSRCQRYDFRRMNIETLSARIQELMEREQLSVEDRAVRAIARAADGSMRDALSLLDQCLAFHYGETLSYAHVLDVLGKADMTVFSALYRGLVMHELETCLTIVNDSVNAGREIAQFVTDFIWYLRNVLLASGTDAAKEVLEVSDEDAKQLSADAELADKKTLLWLMTELSALLNRLRTAGQKRVLLEVELIRLCTTGPQTERKAEGSGAPVQRERIVQRPAYTLSREVRQPEGKTNVGCPDGYTTAAIPFAEQKRETLAEDGKKQGMLPEQATETAENGVTPEQGRGMGASLQNETEYAGYSAGSAAAAISDITRNWDSLLSELTASNRAVFSGVMLKEEQGRVMVVFRNSINYKIAAMNKEENGLTKLKQLVRERLNLSVDFAARIARPGETDAAEDRITEEDLSKINFPVTEGD